MDIAKVQKSLATKALYQPQHRFNDLYRYVRHRDWLEAARHDILQNSGANTPGVDGVKGKSYPKPSGKPSSIRRSKNSEPGRSSRWPRDGCISRNPMADNVHWVFRCCFHTAPHAVHPLGV
jgi:hypothetical protein